MKKALLISALLAGSAALGAGIVAVAQDAPPPPHHEGEHFGKGDHDGHGGHHGMKGPRLEDMDTNGDGDVTQAEIKAFKTATFTEMDTNRDGELSQAEISAHHEKKREEMRVKKEAKMFEGMKKKLDANNDGKITQDEFVSDKMPFFDKIDTNGDGTISAEERAAMKDHHKDKKGKMKKWKENREQRNQD